jgi:eukaryotic-like serine/threonine-protein kinase
VNKEANWERVKDVFSLALDVEPEQRVSFVKSECGDDEDLCRAVISWLNSHTEADDFIEQPAFNIDYVTSNGSPATGKQFGSYRIIKEIGYGGMGAVYLAERFDGEFEQRVAIKIVRQSIAESHVIQRFRHERQILASLNHPNIAKLLDGGLSENNEPYLAMEFVDGERITDYVTARKLSLNDMLRAFLKVCAAVAYAHRNLVVHRDIKPGNILVTAEGEPKLLDFGLAKLVGDDLRETGDRTQTAFRALTPAYASPEQLRGDPITTASDVYSLGVVLYEIVAGKRPFDVDGKSLDDIIRAVTTSPPPPSSEPSQAFTRQQLKGDLDNIILKALRNEPDRRYRSVENFAEDIGRHLEGLPVTARRDTAYYRASKFVLRHRAAVTAAIVVFITLIAGITMTVREKRKADRRFNDVRQLANSLMFEVDSEIQKGPTKGRAMIAKRALEYLDSLALESGNEEDLQLELAAGYLKVGDTQGKPYRPNLGDTTGAEASYQKARTLLQSLFAKDPTNREAQRLLSLSYQSLGRVQERNGEWVDAFESEAQAVTLGEALEAADPTNAQYRSLLADNYLHFGEAIYQTGRGATVADHHKAIEYFRKALKIHSDLAESEPNNPEYRYAAAVDYEYVGIAFNRIGDITGDAGYHAAALENHMKELEINEALAASDPSNAGYRRIVADVYGEVGLSQLRLGRTAEALENFHHKLAIFESVKASDPTNIEAIRDLVNSLIELSNASAGSGNRSEALAEGRRALAMQQILRDAEPDNIATRNQLQALSQTVGDLEKK